MGHDSPAEAGDDSEPGIVCEKCQIWSPTAMNPCFGCEVAEEAEATSDSVSSGTSHTEQSESEDSEEVEPDIAGNKLQRAMVSSNAEKFQMEKMAHNRTLAEGKEKGIARKLQLAMTGRRPGSSTDMTDPLLVKCETEPGVSQARQRVQALKQKIAECRQSVSDHSIFERALLELHEEFKDKERD
jgi:hypothetical protein